MAADDAGNFVVAWHSASLDFLVEDIYLQRFNSAGEKVGPELLVNEVTESAQRDPWLAMDRQGNFVVVWQSFEQMPGQPPGFYAWDVKGRLFRADGSPVGQEFRVNTYTDNEQRNPKVAFSPDGTFAVVWQSNYQDGEDEGVYLQRFAASAGDEPCASAGGHLLCDTGRSGGLPEISLTFGGRPGEVTLLGDADGDGRDDLCTWFKGSFRCDLDHKGVPMEWKVSFGRLTDTPLFGDVDGDGKAEPCVRRKRQLRCDTGHDGGLADTVIALDRGTGTALLGDLDGDGRDDACLVELGQWTCRTRAGTRTSFAFGGPVDAPVLGDLDRDGRGDPCVLQSGRLLCDTAHDGGQAEMSLDLELPLGARPVFGNVDGL